MRGRFDAGGTQEGIEQVKEGVAAAPKPRVHLLAESSELFQLRSVHNRKDELSSLFLSTPDSVTLCCWLKCKLKPGEFAAGGYMAPIHRQRCSNTCLAAICSA